MLLTAAALVARFALDPWLGDSIPFLTFFPATAVAAWYAGVGPAVLAAAFGMIAAHYFFIPAPASFSTGAPVILLYASYAAGSGLLVLLGALARRRAELAERAAETSRQISAALELMRAETKAVLDNVPAVIYHLDAENRFVFANKRYEELLGRPLRELIGKHVDEIFPAEVAARLCANNSEVLARGSTLSFEEHATLGGKPRTYTSIKTPLSLTAGAPGVLGISTDITDQKQTEERLRENEARLRDADRRKDEFLAMLSHELRNPLAPILAAAQYVKLRGPLEHEVQNGVDIIERQAKVMARLVDDLLDLSRLSRGKIELRREHVDVAVAVNDALQACRPLAEQAGHELVVRMPPAPVYVDGDLVRLSQIVANLVNNAVKYTPPGGRIEVTLEERGGRAIISVSDTGIGIPEDMVRRVFDMFAQVDRSTERTHGGLGIGLTLAQQLAKMHGGHIEASSGGADRGSTFTLDLPAVAPQPEARRGERPTAPAFPGLRVLIADDNADAAESLSLLLEARGSTVKVAHDGQEAVDAAAEFRPHLALLDIGMPKLNGYDAARRIRALPQGREIRLVALTGWGQQSDREQSLAAGFDEHVTKPVDLEKLQAVLARAASTAVEGEAESRRGASR